MSNKKQAKPKQTKPKQTKGQKFQKSAKCKIIQSSPMSNTAWTDLNNKGDILKLHDLYGKEGCKSQKKSVLLQTNLNGRFWI